MSITNLNTFSLDIKEFITDNCTLNKTEIKHIFENYKFITNVKYMNQNFLTDLRNFLYFPNNENNIYLSKFFKEKKRKI